MVGRKNITPFTNALQHGTIEETQKPSSTTKHIPFTLDLYVVWDWEPILSLVSKNIKLFMLDKKLKRK